MGKPQVAKKYETDRLFLCLSSPTELEKVLAYTVRNREFLADTEPVRDESFYTAAEQEKMLRADAIAIRNKTGYRFWIVKKEEPNKIIGSMNISNIIRGVFLSCNFGYKLDKDQINKGYMTEAIKKCVDIAFDDLLLHRIEINIMPRNKRSLRVVEKLGFVNEGLSKQYLRINGIWEDHTHMVLLNDHLC